MIAYTQYLAAKNKVEWCKRHFLNYKMLGKVDQVRSHLLKYVKRFRVPLKSSSDSEAIRKAIIAGLFANCAQIQPDGSYKTIRGNHVSFFFLNIFLFQTYFSNTH